MTSSAVKKGLAFSLLLFGIPVLYLAAVVLIGSRVSAEIDSYKKTLIARDDISVVQFDYDRGLFGGQLIYELTWRPEETTELTDTVLQELGFYQEMVNLVGSFDIRHGPWLGGGDLGLARVDVAVQLPDQLRDFLPQYPGRTPVLTLKGILGFGGNLVADLSVLDYDGRIVNDAESALLSISGLGALIQSNSQLTQFSFQVSARRLLLGIPSSGTASVEQLSSVSDISLGTDTWRTTFAFQIGSVKFEEPNSSVLADSVATESILAQLRELNINADFSKKVSQPILGHSDFKLSELTLNFPQEDVRFSVNDYTATNRLGLVNNTVESIATFTIKEVSFNDRVLGGVAMDTSVRGISTDTYAILEELWLSASLDDADLENMLDVFSKLASDRISLSVDRFALMLPSDDDVVATLAIVYNGSSQIDIDSFEDIAGAFSVESSLQASVSAINQAIENAGLSSDQRESIQVMLDDIYQQPYVTVNNGMISSSLRILNGEILINGESFGAAADWYSAYSDAGTSLTDGFAQSDALCPDYAFSGAALSFSSDQLYSPQFIDVFAGGSVDLSLCLSLPGQGYVMTAPDFTLNFSDNNLERALEFRLDSSCDTVLLVNDSNGRWHFDDDSNGSLDALIRIEQARNGAYDIWVGSYNSDGCSASLTLETF